MEYSIDALEVAKWVVTKCYTEGVPISPNHLQKILYIVQREFLRKGKVAFKDSFEAWKLCPILREPYYYFGSYGAMDITNSYNFLPLPYKREDVVIITEILNTAPRKAPWDLVNEYDYEGSAWRRTLDKWGVYAIIDNKDIVKYG